jgi:ribosomal subunit interface protein
MIQAEIKTTDLELTPAIKDYVESKLLQLEKFVNSTEGGVTAQVEIGKVTEHHRSGDVFMAEINLQDYGRVFRAVVTTSDLYAALDQVKDEIVRQVTNNRDKKQTLFRRGARRFKGFIQGWGGN